MKINSSVKETRKRIKYSWNDIALIISGPGNIFNTITKTCPCNVYPPEPHFYIAKLGYAGVYLFFLIFAPKHKLSVLVRTASKFRCNRSTWSREEDIWRVFAIYGHGRQFGHVAWTIYVMYYLSFPLPKEAAHKIWFWLTMSVQRFAFVYGQRTDDRACRSYIPTKSWYSLCFFADRRSRTEKKWQGPDLLVTITYTSKAMQVWFFDKTVSFKHECIESNNE